MAQSTNISLVYDPIMMGTFLNKLKCDSVVIVIMYRRKYDKSNHKSVCLMHKYYEKKASRIIYLLENPHLSLDDEPLLDISAVVALCSVNQINEELASKKAALHIMTQMTLNQPVSRIDKVFLSEVAKSQSTDYLHLDIDIDETNLPRREEILVELKNQMNNYIDPNTIIIETKNGYHILLDTTIQKKIINDFYKKKPIIDGVDVSIMGKGSPCPIPGTLQSGFKIKLL